MDYIDRLVQSVDWKAHYAREAARRAAPPEAGKLSEQMRQSGKRTGPRRGDARSFRVSADGRLEAPKLADQIRRRRPETPPSPTRVGVPAPPPAKERKRELRTGKRDDLADVTVPRLSQQMKGGSNR